MTRSGVPEPSTGAAISAWVRAVEAGWLEQETGCNERCEQRAPRDPGSARSRNRVEREQLLVGGGFDHLVAVQLERVGGIGPEGRRDLEADDL